jgi:hypothetical protein
MAEAALAAPVPAPSVDACNPKSFGRTLIVPLATVDQRAALCREIARCDRAQILGIGANIAGDATTTSAPACATAPATVTAPRGRQFMRAIPKGVAVIRVKPAIGRRCQRQ